MFLIFDVFHSLCWKFDEMKRCIKKFGKKPNVISYNAPISACEKAGDSKTALALLSEMKNYIDLIIPRGGKGLVKKVLKKSTVSIVGHYEGLCHVFVDRDADLKTAMKVVKNSKMRNVSICAAAETFDHTNYMSESLFYPVLLNSIFVILFITLTVKMLGHKNSQSEMKSKRR